MTNIPSVEQRMESLKVTSVLETHTQYLERVQKTMQQDRTALLTELRETIQTIDFYGWNEQTQSKIKEKVQAHLDELIKPTN